MRIRDMLLLLLVPITLSASSCAQSRSQGQNDARHKHDGAAWLGVQLQDLTAQLAKEKGLKSESGALVQSVVEESPAEKAGIRDDDVILSFNGRRIANSEDLVGAVRDAGKGTSVSVVVARGDEQKTLNATLDERPERTNFFSFAPHATPRINMIYRTGGYGLTMHTLNRQLGEYFGAPGGHGVLVEEIRKKSPAAEAGFKAGDVIVKIGKETIENTDDIHSALEDYSKGEKAEFDVLRKGEHKTLSLSIESESHGRFPEMMEFRENGELPSELNMERETLRNNMNNMSEHLRDMGKNIRNSVRGLREKLKSELRHISTI